MSVGILVMSMSVSASAISAPAAPAGAAAVGAGGCASVALPLPDRAAPPDAGSFAHTPSTARCSSVSAAAPSELAFLDVEPRGVGVSRRPDDCSGAPAAPHRAAAPLGPFAVTGGGVVGAMGVKPAAPKLAPGTFAGLTDTCVWPCACIGAAACGGAPVEEPVTAAPQAAPAPNAEGSGGVGAMPRLSDGGAGWGQNAFRLGPTAGAAVTRPPDGGAPQASGRLKACATRRACSTTRSERRLLLQAKIWVVRAASTMPAITATSEAPTSMPPQ